MNLVVKNGSKMRARVFRVHAMTGIGDGQHHISTREQSVRQHVGWAVAIDHNMG